MQTEGVIASSVRINAARLLMATSASLVVETTVGESRSDENETDGQSEDGFILVQDRKIRKIRRNRVASVRTVGEAKQGEK